MTRRPAPEAIAAAIDPLVDAYVSDGSVPGVAIAITDAAGLLTARTAGFADVAARRPVTPETLFEIGSIGKTFTAVTILQLADEGRLAVTDPVQRFLPWFRVPRHGPSITLHHLLSHTAGISAGVDGTPEATAQVARLAGLPPGSAPGRRFHYSNVGYKALGLVIEALEDAPYATVIARRILAPLGMAGSEAAITNAIRPRLAVGYEPAAADRPWTPGDPLAPATWLETGTADGSVAATAPDLAAFERFLMTDRSGIVARMATPVPARGGEGYGYALMNRTVDGRRFLGHTGGMVGFISGMHWDRDAGIGAVVLQNGPGGAPNAFSRLLVRRAVAVAEGRDPGIETMETFAAPPSEGVQPTSTPAAWGVPADVATRVAGTYVSHSPWIPQFRVERRGNVLWLTFPSTPDGFDDEQPLVPMARGWFRAGEDRLGPERVRFDLVIDGRARRAWLSGWDYYREDRRT